MTMEAYRDEIKLKLTGYVLDLEIEDSTIDKIINSALREIQRYIDITWYETIPFDKCIDLGERKINMISHVYRASSMASSSDGTSTADPMYMMQWQVFAGNSSNFDSMGYFSNYASYLQSLQLRNTMSTDLAFKFDRQTNKLYINVSTQRPAYVTIEYIPRFDNVEQIKSDYWTDIIIKLSIALTKVTLGRIRTRFNQSSALWTQDGEALLSEGNSELDAIREKLKSDTQLVYGID